MDIKHPIFMECARLVNDEFWQFTLIQAAKGKFPKNYTYYDGKLHYGKDKINVDNVNPKELVNKIINFFKTTSGMYSKDDIVLDEVKHQRKEFENNWSKISSNNVKLKLINDYAKSLGKDMGLNDDQINCLATVILIGIDTKLLDSRHIHMDNGKIVKIDNIVFDNGMAKLINRGTSKLINKGNIEVIDDNSENKYITPSFYKLWIKYLSQLTGNSIKYIDTTDTTNTEC